MNESESVDFIRAAVISFVAAESDQAFAFPTLSNAIIVDVEPTPARTYDEVESTKTMLDRTERCFGLKPKRLAADTAYGTGRFLGWLVGRRIAPHIPVRDASERDDGTLSVSYTHLDVYKRQGERNRQHVGM